MLRRRPESQARGGRYTGEATADSDRFDHPSICESVYVPPDAHALNLPRGDESGQVTPGIPCREEVSTLGETATRRKHPSKILHRISMPRPQIRDASGCLRCEHFGQRRFRKERTPVHGSGCTSDTPSRSIRIPACRLQLLIREQAARKRARVEDVCPGNPGIDYDATAMRPSSAGLASSACRGTTRTL